MDTPSHAGKDETPLQVNLNGIATIIGKFGFAVTVLTFIMHMDLFLYAKADSLGGLLTTDMGDGRGAFRAQLLQCGRHYHHRRRPRGPAVCRDAQLGGRHEEAHARVRDRSAPLGMRDHGVKRHLERQDRYTYHQPLVVEKVNAAHAKTTVNTAKDFEQFNSAMIWEVFAELLLEGVF
ncbi:hypothetical protein QYE76_005260 [Lolium multiflorum]|uniref:Uncharacterized protein n=1 Tax=Lolium multiflorum TaxID=4521 RepID=A0AAD8W0K1_LOLMU|nr:hypothetical protein QYE76_005260 [Lolium multiflorum]